MQCKSDENGEEKINAIYKKIIENRTAEVKSLKKRLKEKTDTINTNVQIITNLEKMLTEYQ